MEKTEPVATEHFGLDYRDRSSKLAFSESSDRHTSVASIRTNDIFSELILYKSRISQLRP